MHPQDDRPGRPLASDVNEADFAAREQALLEGRSRGPHAHVGGGGAQAGSGPGASSETAKSAPRARARVAKLVTTTFALLAGGCRAQGASGIRLDGHSSEARRSDGRRIPPTAWTKPSSVWTIP